MNNNKNYKISNQEGVQKLDLDLTNIVFINEIQGYQDDYVELYNAGGKEVDISNFVLDDKYNNESKEFGDKYFTLPQGSTIQAKGFLVFYKGNDQEVAAGTHFKFGIKSRGGETITLVNGTTIIDQLVGPDENNYDEPFNEGRSYGRYPNGSDNLMLMIPTPGVSNEINLNLNKIEGYDYRQSGIDNNGFTDNILIVTSENVNYTPSWYANNNATVVDWEEGLQIQSSGTHIVRDSRFLNNGSIKTQTEIEVYIKEYLSMMNKSICVRWDRSINGIILFIREAVDYNKYWIYKLPKFAIYYDNLKINELWGVDNHHDISIQCGDPEACNYLEEGDCNELDCAGACGGSAYKNVDDCIIEKKV